MPIDFQELVLKPCMNSFGRTVNYIYRQSGENIQIQAVFDNVTRLHDPIPGMDAGDSGVVACRVVMGVRLDDFLIQPDMGDHVIMDEVNFIVQEVQKDGQGGAHLVLNNAEV